MAQRELCVREAEAFNLIMLNAEVDRSAEITSVKVVVLYPGLCMLEVKDVAAYAHLGHQGFSDSLSFDRTATRLLILMP